MNSENKYNSYQDKKEDFHNYINKIKKSSNWDLYSIINSTLIKNPYNTNFPKKFFFNNFKIENKIMLFIKSSIKFYVKQFYFFGLYLMNFFIFKILYRKKIHVENQIGIDIFLLVDTIIKDKKFNEKYFIGLYDILQKYNKEYIFLPRLYGLGKTPIKFISLLNILNKEKENFLFDFELLTISDFGKLFCLILLYPIKTRRLLQKENTKIDCLFNNELLYDIRNMEFDAFTRYLYGINIAKLQKVDLIYSWSEFQVIERSFNYGVRKFNNKLELVACQFYLNYETYFNTYIDDLDFEMGASPHKVLVNGKYYIRKTKKVDYRKGVSLRYKKLFDAGNKENENNNLLLGSYISNDTKYMLESIKDLDNVIFKNHPAVNILALGDLPKNISVTDENIYQLFKNTKLVISTASGSALEAVASGISVIIISSKDNLTANPLIEYGKGEIWDLAFSKDDIKKLYNKLINYRENNRNKIQNIASWYREEFFIEPTEENIVEVFELDYIVKGE